METVYVDENETGITIINTKIQCSKINLLFFNLYLGK